MKKICLRLSSLIPILLLSFVGLVHPAKTFASECNAPNVPMNVSAVSGPNAGEVTLYWDGSPFADRYAVAYGTEAGQYIYGADNIGGEPSRSYTVSYLTPGQTYHFVLSAASGSCASGFSTEVWATATPGVVGPMMENSMSMSSSGLQVSMGMNSSQAVIKWGGVAEADNYHLVYGTTSKVDQYGALNIGNTSWFTVDRLEAGKTYYFSLIPVSHGMAMKAVGPVRFTSVSSESMTVDEPIRIKTPAMPMPSTIVVPKVSTAPVIKVSPTAIPVVTTPSSAANPSYFIP